MNYNVGSRPDILLLCKYLLVFTGRWSRSTWYSLCQPETWTSFLWQIYNICIYTDIHMYTDTHHTINHIPRHASFEARPSVVSTLSTEKKEIYSDSNVKENFDVNKWILSKWSVYLTYLESISIYYIRKQKKHLQILIFFSLYNFLPSHCYVPSRPRGSSVC